MCAGVVRLDGAHAGAGIGDCREYFTLMAGVTFDGSYQVGHQVGAALVLVEHL